MKCDERGNIWVTGPGGIWVLGPDGEHLGIVGIPESVGNLHWGGPDWSWMYVTASTGLYRFKAKTSARREPFMRCRVRGCMGKMTVSRNRPNAASSFASTSGLSVL